MSDLHDECGVVAVYHLPGRGVSPLCPEQGPEEISRLVPRISRVTPTWACGLPGLDSRMQYTSTAFSKPLRKVFSQVYKPDRTVEILPVDQPCFPKSIAYRSVRTTSFERSLYRPALDAIVAAANRLRRLQTGNIQVYLLYMFLALIAVLVYMRFA